MSALIAPATARADFSGPARLRAWLAQGENWLLAGTLAAIVLLPLIEAVLRKVADTGIAGSASLVQHLTLLASMLGAAVGARDGKLLAFFNVTALLGPRAQRLGHLASHLLDRKSVV